jgi:predicted RNA binding protein YcfA (HicA-like mRNA interferase family)
MGGDKVPLSGKEMLRLYEKKGWSILRKRGSHVQMGKEFHRETIPMHKELKKGLERKLLKRFKQVK